MWTGLEHPKGPANVFNILSIWLNDVDCCGGQTISIRHSTKPHERPCIQSQAAAAVVTVDTDRIRLRETD